jgi:hypothetical protein
MLGGNRFDSPTTDKNHDRCKQENHVSLISWHEGINELKNGVTDLYLLIAGLKKSSSQGSPPEELTAS